MLSISVCPRCEERVRVPDIEGPAEVRCPWCGESFELQEVTRHLPPVLEIVSLPAAEDVSEDYASVSVSEIDDQPFEERSSSRVEKISDSLSSPFPEPMEFGSGKRRRRHSSSSRSHRRRRRDSPVVGFLKMAGGGVAGILIALLILQSINRLPNLGVWPFLGPGTSLNPVKNWGKKDLVPSPDPLAQNNQPSDEDSAQRAENKSDSIDLGVADFATSEAETEDNETGTDESIVEQATEILNAHIRGEEPAEDVATKFRERLVNAELDTAAPRVDLDKLIERLAYEKQILKALLEKSRDDIAEFRLDMSTRADSASLVLVGKVISKDSGLALQMSANAEDLLPLVSTSEHEDLVDQESVFLIGQLKRMEDQRTEFVVRYCKSILTNRSR